ncbi:hypothetical protein J132_08350 [Termitomyces sp. J132]|nr:hypothetical protein H2248_004357 [Termitomyces sp. 'cryptogamus']KNZ74040.1 hypothetical protein J132_08350 [Termitomyces sp. J132]
MISTIDSSDATDATSTIVETGCITESPATSNSANNIPPSEGIEDHHQSGEELLPCEVFWRDQYELLEEYGYTLRARYHPNWKPSWIGTSKRSDECEDGQLPPASGIMDASCPDGTLVMLKQISSEDKEIYLGELLSQRDFNSFKFPENHCVPFLEILEPPNCRYAILVMPYLVDWALAPFETIGEVVEFFRQIFEGLLFMHNQNIAHTNIKFNNIMADSLSSFSYPPHPSSPPMKYDFSGKTEVVRSRTKHPIKYYFGLSDTFDSKTETSEQPPFGGTRNCPGVWRSNISPCNLFLVDIFCTGNVIRQFLFDDDGSINRPKQGFMFMRELVDDMINSDPLKRPSMKQVVERYEIIYTGLSEWKLRSPVVTARKRFKLRKAVMHWTKQLVRMARGIPAIPRV